MISAIMSSRFISRRKSVDLVRKIASLTSEREAKQLNMARQFDIARHAKMKFGMFDGNPVQVVLALDLYLTNVVRERFGNDIHANEREPLEIITKVTNSPCFLVWIFQFGSLVEIVPPDNLRMAMSKLVRSTREMPSLSIVMKTGT